MTSEAYITSLYNSILDRNPDAGGLRYYLHSDMSRAKITASIGGSHEAYNVNHYGLEKVEISYVNRSAIDAS